MLDFKRRKLLENKANPLIKGVFFGSPPPPSCQVSAVTLTGGIFIDQPVTDDAVLIENNCEDVCINVLIRDVISGDVIRSETDVPMSSPFVNVVWLGDPLLIQGVNYRVIVQSCDGVFTFYDQIIQAL